MLHTKKILSLCLAALLLLSAITLTGTASESPAPSPAQGLTEIRDTVNAAITNTVAFAQRLVDYIIRLFGGVDSNMRKILPEHLIINQIYALGSKSNDGQAGSHSFVELYNPTAEAVALEGYSLQACGAGTAWAVLPLKGSIPAHGSFLVVLTEVTNLSPAPRLLLDPAKADMQWANAVFPNKGLKVALLQGTAALSCANPFDTDGSGTKASGYVDMIGVAGNDSGSSIDGCETAFRALQSKQLALRRSNYNDTDNNALDVVAIDYRTANLKLYAPKSTADGRSLPQVFSDLWEWNAKPVLPKVYLSFNDKKTLKDLNKADYLGAQVTLSGAAEYDVPLQPAGVRLRGNTTAYGDKKPMRIKFDSPVSMFGRPAEKSWVLLANYFDYSLMRNYLAYNTYDFLTPDGTFASLVEFVDVYVNGEYQGVYTLCDQIQEGSGRAAVTTVKNDPTASGYLLEMDMRSAEEGGVEGTDYFKAADSLYAVKFPDPDDGISAAQMDYIQGYVQSVHNAVAAKDWAEIQRLIDVQSFIDYFMLAEIYQTTDVGVSSVFLRKDNNGKLFMGPAWDYDLSAGNANNSPLEPTGSFWAESINPLFGGLMQCPEFLEAYTADYQARYPAVRAYIQTLIDEAYAKNRTAFERNFRKWDMWKYDHVLESPAVDAINSHKGQVEYLREFLLTRMDWLNTQYAQRRGG